VASSQIPLSPEVLADFSVEKVEGVSFGGHYFALTGGQSGLKVDTRKGTWSFSGKQATLISGLPDDDLGPDLVLHTEDGVSVYNPHRHLTSQNQFNFDARKHQQTPATITGKTMMSFAIGLMTLRTVAGKAGGDSLVISNSSLDIGTAFPEEQAMLITVGSQTFRLPAVNDDTQHWQKNGAIYSYTNNHFPGGAAAVKLDTERKSWELKLSRAALGGLAFAAVPVVRLAIGNYEAAMVLAAEQTLTGK
jgi:hypothetical protein